ncbi:hypothetical protein [Parashewanella tropica]|uniref:hypothetical protein n=1 Tax=Parashewanella tropica TaxID=2547970 RepID=UPI001059A920|nr:hypothetical protein [Parashewanella tropica]
MPLPLFLLGGAVSAIVLAEYKQQRKEALINRYYPRANSKKAELKYSPSLIHSSNTKVKPIAGAMVCCHVYGLVCHVGIWCDDAIIELHGSGLVRVVSPERFLKQRSGETIYIACNSQAEPLASKIAANNAKELIFSFRKYDLIANNCYRFTWFCLSGEEVKISSFTELNQQLANYFKQDIYWDELIYI